MLDVIIKILLAMLLSVQLITLICLLYTDIKSYKADKKFWKEMDEALKYTIKRYNYLMLGDNDEGEQNQDQS